MIDANYYAIIPANVRYDTKISDKAKLLYGEITALANKEGYCWASNAYFAELFGVNKKSISRNIQELVDRGYIISRIIYEGKMIKERRLYINNPTNNIIGCTEIISPIHKKEDTPIYKKEDSPIHKIVEENNTSINNTSINNIYSQIIDYLNKKVDTKYRSTSKKTKSLITARLNEGFTKEDFYKVIDNKSSEWLGTNMQQYLRPETLFGTKFEGYLNQKAGVISNGGNNRIRSIGQNIKKSQEFEVPRKKSRYGELNEEDRKRAMELI
ncbi:conserved phage C-terminal domain-containing protein [Clostridium sp.]|uniref:conserved phage C-terminal domain-containing protein n=1 Tax=Clostridium sp. TaxID=1506 RepID=UPI0011592E7F|nr:conserved phage C-terminal domain-containing protein [Clostridium sp.]